MVCNEEKNVYFVPDGTEMCGYYECKDCGNRFLSLKIGPQIVCPACGEEPGHAIVACDNRWRL